jgi:hypothetical protein
MPFDVVGARHLEGHPRRILTNLCRPKKAQRAGSSGLDTPIVSREPERILPESAESFKSGGRNKLDPEIHSVA